MAGSLSVVREELERLRSEGIERVFLDDTTVALIGDVARESPSPLPAAPATAVAAPAPPPPQEPEKQEPAFPPPPAIDLPDGDAATRLAWLRERVESCPVCREHLSSRGKIVFGEGAPDADIFFCGEAPGADEEVAGEPFVGPAGQLLTKIISAMGLDRENVYIGNILKWRPEHDKPFGNRPPTLEEMTFCLPYLRAQIEIIQPKVLVALGNTAVTGLLGPDPDRRMGSVRGKWHTFENIPLMITFHPSYLLRNGTMRTKRMVWEDMLKVMEKVPLPISEKQRSYFLEKS